ncbi:MAG: glycine--tRNA ligase subunit beta [Alphaproteobacteria bacterium]|nr:glycine--tRNA ligase subunit beta [Alphaproteobacteria bacterium]MCW5743576.1 glycine--tRNA ligase subunit beta [Alphaproteobacteria bacterium]
MAKLVLELLSEEIPARMQARAAEDLKRLFGEGLTQAGLDFAFAAAFATPRRLVLAMDGIPLRSADVREEKRGPRTDAPARAIEGFLRGAGLTSLDQCEKRDTGKGEFYFAVSEKKGRNATEVLREVVGRVLSGFPWPKSMRWGARPLSWVRPLQQILCVFNGVPLKGGIVENRADSPDFYFDAAAQGGTGSRFVFVESPRESDIIVPARETTRGHRFMAPGEIRVEGYTDYVRKLKQAYVMVDAEERKAVIRTKAETACREAGVTLVKDDGLLAEVAGLVEWPVPMMGTIDREFMDVPAEVLITSMKTHQRYFACHTRGGELANRFVVVANTVAPDGGREIVAGNERVLRARLSDARFFWDQDRKARLADRLPALKDIVFHAKLGTQAERVERIVKLAQAIVQAETCGFFHMTDPAHVETAARLAKADLTSGMVGEFPELQGVMGGYYAQIEGLPLEVSIAIADHYGPTGPDSRCPKSPVSVAVALADKLDTLVGFWAIDEKPTGSKDPYALRRAALGSIRLITENGLRLKLTELFKAAAAGRAINSAELLDFFADRLKVQVREQGVRHDLVNAVFALGNEDDLVRLLARVKALQDFVGSDDGRNLLVAYNRAANIVKAEERKDKALAAQVRNPPDAALFEQDEEKAVAAALRSADATAGPALLREDYTAAMSALAALRAPLDSFFEKVTVNVADRPDLRLNRLRLLRQISGTIDHVADFSEIEG